MINNGISRLSNLRSGSGVAFSLHPHGLGFLTSNRFALTFAVIFGVFIPELFHPWALSVLSHSPALTIYGIRASFFGSIVAIVVGHISLSRFTALPTIDAKAYIFPSFLMSYAAVLALVYASSTPFGHYHFFISFAIVVPWYFSLAVLRERHIKPHLALIGPDPNPLIDILQNVQWTVLKVPLLNSHFSAIVVDSHRDLQPEWEHLIAESVLQGIPVHDAKHMREALTRRVEISHMADNNFGSLLPALTYVRIKRIIDLIFALPAAIVALPFLLALAVVIRIESHGAPIFSQQRMGFRGKPFTLYKLRTMKHGEIGDHFTSHNDIRITRLGAVLRRYRIDELPQIWNIIRGDMSWIGPRPEALELAETYEENIPFYVYRHAVRPGISGWAAVHQGNVAQVDAATVKLQYDFFYIKYCSLWLDVLIFLMTLRTVVTGFGSR
jgi:lipopolysaccharide/colanic/teichoic acid biosynthesis glycosyltransferase